MSRVLLEPGEVTLDSWRQVYEGAAIELDARCIPQIQQSAAAVQRILARGEPIYGINTGFGRLASVRIDSADLAKLQRNIVLSHCTGVGELLSPAITRL